ncbi:MAG: HAD family hydrolase [Alphaproteobacteria bacterium]|nr:HAD family hydrolase [Alphaproteobacteria bacterium]
MPEPRPALFLDRDGVINIDHGYPYRVEDFNFMPDAAEAIKFAHESGIPIFVVTNQGGIGLGYFDEAAVHRFHAHMLDCISTKGGQIMDIAFCSHHPNAIDPAMRDCSCRKPKPGMIFDLASRHQIDLNRSVMIGDRDTDMAAANAAGCHGLLYSGGSLLPIMMEAVKRLSFTDGSYS